MFATFNSSMDKMSTTTSAATSAPSSRPKRVTVARACDWCRMNRVKCDPNHPCKNCRNRGVQCTKAQLTEQTNSADSREIERLQSRMVKLKKKTEQEATAARAPPSPPDTQDSSSTILNASLSRSQWHWPGVWIPNPFTDQSHYYGPSSLNYFVHRMAVYLSESSLQPKLASDLQSCNNHRASISLEAALQKGLSDSDPLGTMNNLSRRQEEYLLSLFWQSYHLITPIVDEAELRAHYESLWLVPGSSQLSQIRKPSAQIDVVLAMCMQYSAALLTSGNPGSELNLRDANTRGQWLYHRCQLLLSSEVDAPSISSFRCYVYSAIYLLNASCLDQARLSLAVAVNVAYSLGLNHDPPDRLSTTHQALLRRMWWTVFFLDAKLSIELGMPYLINLSDATIKLSEPQGTLVVNSNTPMYEDISPLTYHTQYIKLAMRVRAISTSMFSRASQLMTIHGGTYIHENNQVLEKCSGILRQNMESIQSWLEEVPPALKLARKGSGEAFSTTKSLLEIDLYAPLWLQRQRVLLELLYHNLIIYIYRPFIKFPPAAAPAYAESSLNYMTDRNAPVALSHAMAMINIIHQVLLETDILNSWNRALQYTWDAVVTVLGFIVVHPLCPYTSSARKAIALAIEAFDTFAGYGFPAAANAATTVQNINNMVEGTVKSFGSSLSPGAQRETSLSHFSSPLQASSTHFANTRPSDAQNLQTLQLQTPTDFTPSMVNTLASPLVSQASVRAESMFEDVTNYNMSSMPMDFSPDMLSTFDQSWASWENNVG